LGVLEGFLAECRAGDQKGICVPDDLARIIHRDLQGHKAGMRGAYAGGKEEHRAPDPLSEKLVVPVAQFILR
jgi:hypothetical protein